MNLCSSKLKASKGSRWSERLFVCPEASYRTVMSCVCLSRVVSLCSELEESFWPDHTFSAVSEEGVKKWAFRKRSCLFTLYMFL